MAIDVGYLTAVGAGAISFLSPCVLPLVPPYLCYMAGVSVDDFRGDGGKATHRPSRAAACCSRRWLSCLAFPRCSSRSAPARRPSAACCASGRSRSAIVAGVAHHPDGPEFSRHCPDSVPVARGPVPVARGACERAGAYVMGLAFAFGWTPCIGPVLGPILTLAGGSETVGDGALLLAVYSLGLGIPFLIAALFSGALHAVSLRFRVHLGRVEKVIGVLLVVAGVFFMSGGMQSTSYWLLETFPVLEHAWLRRAAAPDLPVGLGASCRSPEGRPS